jgi:MFS family permease
VKLNMKDHSKSEFKPFFRLATSEALNTGSSSTLFIAMPLIGITALDATSMEVGFVTAAGTAAPLVFGLSAGAMADRQDRCALLFWCGVARLLLVATLPLLLAFDLMSIALLCAVNFGLSIVKLLFDSVVSAVIPTVVRRDEVAKANSWFEALNSTAYALGPAIAGWLLQAASAVSVFALNALLYLASSVCLRGVSLPPMPKPRYSHIADIAYGVRLLWRNEIQRTVAFSTGAFNAFYAAFFTVFTFYALKHLDFDAASLGTVVSLVGLTGLAGALCIPGMLRMFGASTLMVGSFLLIGPLGIPITFAHHLEFPHRAVLIGACLAAWEFMIVVHMILEQTMRQVMVENRHLSRMAATTRFVSWGADPIGALLGGLAASSTLGCRGTLLICLLGFVVSGAVLLTSKGIRALKNEHVGFRDTRGETP